MKSGLNHLSNDKTKNCDNNEPTKAIVCPRIPLIRISKPNCDFKKNETPENIIDLITSSEIVPPLRLKDTIPKINIHQESYYRCSKIDLSRA